MSEYKKCFEEGGLKKIEPAKHIAEKELKEAAYDLEMAKASLEKKDAKWAEIKAYYCCFHAARALLFLIGLREKGHYYTFIALKELFAKQLGDYVENYKNQIKRRELADYYATYSLEEAKAGIKFAENFLFKVKEIYQKLVVKSSLELKKIRDKKIMML